MNNIQHDSGYFSAFVNQMRREKKLIVQPRMGFGTVDSMHQGLKAVKNTHAPTIGTITIDSYTRVNQYAAAKNALDSGHTLNGYPLVTHGAEVTKNMLKGLLDRCFPIQVRHGTALPQAIFKEILACGLDATEGGPVSYCLPYSRIPLAEAISAWVEAASLFGEATQQGRLCHIESFAGCMLGQLCPPSLLIALTVLECLFFKAHGVKSVSLSFTQGTNSQQDLAALSTLRKLASLYLHDVDWHVVVYTYMGVYPCTEQGALNILKESVRIATISGCERLIVKTSVEAQRIPTIAENVTALEVAYNASERLRNLITYISLEEQEVLCKEAKFLIEMALNADANLGNSLLKLFQKGYLDIPYCVHRDNLNQARCYIDNSGYLRWADFGNIPFPRHIVLKKNLAHQVGSAELLKMLQYNKMKYDI